jgi:NhaP-type Na+/H+ or K+/H+ antiporter
MDNAVWFLFVGGLLLTMGLTAPAIKRLPVTSAIIYLALGLLVGPTVLGLFHFNPLKESALLEVLTEVAVLISLFAAGVKMPVPVTFARWRVPILLAFFGMAATVAMVTLFGYYLLGLPVGAAVLLGAIVAPTDPVLATEVQIRHPGDRDRLRFTLTCEAGMNDGSAFRSSCSVWACSACTSWVSLVSAGSWLMFSGLRSRVSPSAWRRVAGLRTW